MSAQAAIEIGLYSGCIPAIAAVIAFVALGWLLPDRVTRRYRPGVALALGVWVGFAFAPLTKTLVPSQFWEWIAYLGMLAAFVGGLAQADGVSRGERWAAILLVTVAAAWTIVPGWARLADVRLTHVAILAAGMFALSIMLEPFADRLAGRGLPFWLMFAAAASALLITSEWSEMLGRSAALPAGALAGCGIAMLLTKSGAAPRGLALPYAVVVGGYAYVGFVYPSPPLTPLLFAPLVPLVLWLCAWGPLARLTGVRALAAQAVCVVVPLVIIGALVVMRSSGDE